SSRTEPEPRRLGDGIEVRRTGRRAARLFCRGNSADHVRRRGDGSAPLGRPNRRARATGSPRPDGEGGPAPSPGTRRRRRTVTEEPTDSYSEGSFISMPRLRRACLGLILRGLFHIYAAPSARVPRTHTPRALSCLCRAFGARASYSYTEGSFLSWA